MTSSEPCGALKNAETRMFRPSYYLGGEGLEWVYVLRCFASHKGTKDTRKGVGFCQRQAARHGGGGWGFAVRAGGQ